MNFVGHNQVNCYLKNQSTIKVKSGAMMKTVVALLLISITLNAFAQSGFNDPGRLDRIKKSMPMIEKMVKDYQTSIKAPAISYGIVVDGHLILLGATGFINVEKKTPAKTNSAFRIASMTKSFTAMAILLLRDDGKLDLDDPVSKYVPGYGSHELPTKDAPVVTIRDLLTHAAGLPEDNPSGDRQLAYSDEELLQFINAGLSYSNVPGVAYEYSNLGYMTLGFVIRNASGQSYQDFIREKILEPLDMNDTYWEYAEVPANQLALAYRWVNGKWVQQPILHDGAGGAMGGMITTIEDFSKYMAFHQSAWPPSDAAQSGPVKRSTVREMHRPANYPILNANYKYPSGRACATVTAYGYGLRWVKDCEGRQTITHTGGLPGYGSVWQILPEYGIGVAIFANVTYAPTSILATRIVDTLIKVAKLEPRKIEPTAILLERKDQLLNLLPDWKDAESTGIFAENFFDDYFIESLRNESKMLFAKAGKIIRVEEIIPENRLRGSFIIRGEKAKLLVRFTLSAGYSPKIQAFRISEINN